MYSIQIGLNTKKCLQALCLASLTLTFIKNITAFKSYTNYLNIFPIHSFHRTGGIYFLVFEVQFTLCRPGVQHFYLP